MQYKRTRRPLTRHEHRRRIVGVKLELFLDGPGWRLAVHTAVDTALASQVDTRLRGSASIPRFRTVCPSGPSRLLVESSSMPWSTCSPCHWNDMRAFLEPVQQTSSASTASKVDGQDSVGSETSDHIAHPNWEELRKQRSSCQSDATSLRGHALRRLRRNGFGRGPTAGQRPEHSRQFACSLVLLRFDSRQHLQP